MIGHAGGKSIPDSMLQLLDSSHHKDYNDSKKDNNMNMLYYYDVPELDGLGSY